MIFNIILDFSSKKVFKGVVIIYAFVWFGFSFFLWSDILVSETDAMHVCRFMSIVAAILMFVCSGCLIFKIFKIHFPPPNGHQRLDEDVTYPVQMSVKLFLFIMTFVSMAGYFLRGSYIYVLMDFDFALNYSNKTLMVWADGFYIISVLMYLPLQLFYLWFYMKEHGSFKNWCIWVFAASLILNFWQKWLFESLVAHEKLCEKHNITCFEPRKYETNHSSLSEAQQEAYHSMEMVSPLSYSCTMEIFAVYVVALCFPKSKRRRQRHVGNVDNRGFAVNKGLAWVLGILMIVMLILAALGLYVKIITLYHDEEHKMETETDLRNILKLIWFFVEMVICSGCFYIYWEFDMNPTVPDVAVLDGNDDIVQGNANPGVPYVIVDQHLPPRPHVICINTIISGYKRVKNYLLFSWFRAFLFQTNEPDLVILQLTYVTGIIGFSIRFLLHAKNVFAGNFIIKHWGYSIIPSLFGYISAGMNLVLLHIFLTKKSNLQRLYENTFTKAMIPYQIIRCFSRAAYYYTLNLDPNVPIPKDEGIFVLLFNAAYPFAPLMYITSALCWCHVLGKFFSKNAYFSNNIVDDDYTSVSSTGLEHDRGEVITEQPICVC